MSEYLRCPCCGSHKLIQSYGILHEYGTWQEGWDCVDCGEQWFTMDGEVFVPVDAQYGAEERPPIEVSP